MTVEPITQYLVDYGALGLFVLYLMYDRQIVLKGIIKALNQINETLHVINNGK